MTKQDLIKHCERQIKRHANLPYPHSDLVLLEHKIFLELLQGRDVNEMFNENGEYNESID